MKKIVEDINTVERLMRVYKLSQPDAEKYVNLKKGLRFINNFVYTIVFAYIIFNMVQESMTWITGIKIFGAVFAGIFLFSMTYVLILRKIFLGRVV